MSAELGVAGQPIRPDPIFDSDQFALDVRSEFGDCSYRVTGAVALAPDHRASEVGGERSKPLDLIEEHLTVNNSQKGFRPAQAVGRLMANWSVPDDWEGPDTTDLSVVLKIQPFAAGGFEGTVRYMDLGRIARAMEFGGHRGKREAPGRAKPENVEKAGRRAKAKVRKLTKNMGATHLCTLTRRESDPAAFWSTDDWLKAWDRLRRNLVKVIGEFPYVAILEQHMKGNYHLHIAWVGRINLNVMRPLWWAVCGGRGEGNVDAQYIKVRSGCDRSDRIAKYISKYVAKHFNDIPRFNKKRYWASRQTVDEARRYVLRSRTLEDHGNPWARTGAAAEVADMLGLDMSLFIDIRTNRTPHLFVFPDRTGWWFSYIPELHSTPSPL